MLAAPAAYALVLLNGLVTIGPTSPVCRVGTPCTKPAAHTLLEFTRHQHIAFATTDAKGRYSLKISPGTWSVTVIAGVRTTPNRIIVRSVRPFATRNFTLDSGIR